MPESGKLRAPVGTWSGVNRLRQGWLVVSPPREAGAADSHNISVGVAKGPRFSPACVCRPKDGAEYAGVQRLDRYGKEEVIVGKPSRGAAC